MNLMYELVSNYAKANKKVNQRTLKLEFKMGDLMAKEYIHRLKKERIIKRWIII